MIPVSLEEVPSLHQFTHLVWGHKFCSSDERWLMLRTKEILKHTWVREPVVWSGTHKGQVQTVSVFLHPEVKLAAPFGSWSSIKLLLTAHSTKHSPLNVLALYPHCTCWQLKSPAYTHGDGNTGRDIFKSVRMEVCRC